MHIVLMGTAIETTEKRPLLFIGNRWVNTIYTGYGPIKQRILLQILESIQPEIRHVMTGNRFTLPANQATMAFNLDLSKITKYNNYHQARQAIQEMISTPIEIYNDTTFKKQIYFPAPLLCGSWPGPKNKIVVIELKREILELLLHVDFQRAPKGGKKPAPFQFTKFDPFTIRNSRLCKYTMPLYMMICSYAEKGGFEISAEDFRRRMQADDKYKDFHEIHRHILKHVKAELDISGAYGFQFKCDKAGGREVKKIVFKIYANTKYDPNHVWLKIQRALTSELPYFARFTELQQDQFNYLLTGKFDLDEVLKKLFHIHAHLERHRKQGTARKDPFAYTLKGLHDAFPPPS